MGGAKVFGLATQRIRDLRESPWCWGTIVGQRDGAERKGRSLCRGGQACAATPSPARIRSQRNSRTANTLRREAHPLSDYQPGTLFWPESEKRNYQPVPRPPLHSCRQEPLLSAEPRRAQAGHFGTLDEPSPDFGKALPAHSCRRRVHSAGRISHLGIAVAHAGRRDSRCLACVQELQPCTDAPPEFAEDIRNCAGDSGRREAGGKEACKTKRHRLSLRSGFSKARLKSKDSKAATDNQAVPRLNVPHFPLIPRSQVRCV